VALNRRDLLRQAALSTLVLRAGLGNAINQLTRPSVARAINALAARALCRSIASSPVVASARPARPHDHA